VYYALLLYVVSLTVLQEIERAIYKHFEVTAKSLKQKDEETQKEINGMSYIR